MSIDIQRMRLGKYRVKLWRHFWLDTLKLILECWEVLIYFRAFFFLLLYYRCWFNQASEGSYINHCLLCFHLIYLSVGSRIASLFFLTGLWLKLWLVLLLLTSSTFIRFSIASTKIPRLLLLLLLAIILNLCCFRSLQISTLYLLRLLRSSHRSRIVIWLLIATSAAAIAFLLIPVTAIPVIIVAASSSSRLVVLLLVIVLLIVWGGWLIRVGAQDITTILLG